MGVVGGVGENGGVKHFLTLLTYKMYTKVVTNDQRNPQLSLQEIVVSSSVLKSSKVHIKGGKGKDTVSSVSGRYLGLGPSTKVQIHQVIQSRATASSSCGLLKDKFSSVNITAILFCVNITAILNSVNITALLFSVNITALLYSVNITALLFSVNITALIYSVNITAILVRYHCYAL